MVLFRTILHYISIARDSRSLVHSYFFSTFLHFSPFFQPNISSFSLAWLSYLAKPGLRSASESAALALLSRFLADDHAPALGSRDGPLVLASSIYLSIAKANFATVAPIADFSVEDKRIDKRIGNRIDKTYRWSLFSAPQEALAVKPKRGGPRDWIAFSPH